MAPDTRPPALDPVGLIQGVIEPGTYIEHVLWERFAEANLVGLLLSDGELVTRPWQAVVEHLLCDVRGRRGAEGLERGLPEFGSLPWPESCG